MICNIGDNKYVSSLKVQKYHFICEDNAMDRHRRTM